MTKSAPLLLTLLLLSERATGENPALAKPIKSTYSGKPWRSLKAYNLETAEVTFSPDGRFLAAVGQNNIMVTTKENGRTLKRKVTDYTVKIWSTSTWKLSRTLRLKGLIGNLFFSPDGKFLGVVASNTVTIYKTADGQITRTLGSQSEFGPIAFSPRGDVLSVGNELIDIQTWKSIYSLPVADEVYTVAYAPDGKMIATGSWNGVVQVWDVDTGKQKKMVYRAVDFVKVVFSPDGKMLSTSCGSDKAIQLWNTANWQRVRSFLGGKTVNMGALGNGVSGIDSVAFSPDSKKLVTASMSGLKLWDIATGRVLHTFHGESERFSAYSVAFSPDGRLVAAASRDATIDLWKVPLK